jgi:hypothetical protein
VWPLVSLVKQKKEAEEARRKLEDNPVAVLLYWRKQACSGDVQLSHLYRQTGVSTNADVFIFCGFHGRLSPLPAV